MYYKNYKRVKIGSEIKPNPSIYKVNNLKKDSLVCFTYRADNNPFEVCNDNIGECSKKIDFYKFLGANLSVFEISEKKLLLIFIIVLPIEGK